MTTITKTPTETRVERHTRPEINEQICRQTDANVAYYARHPEQIEQRLRELDREWDIERTLETNAGIVALSGLVLGKLIRPLGLLPFAVAGFLVQHAIQGWCPPVPLFRRLGIRTTREINRERFALKALRGDFGAVHDEIDVEQRARAALAAAETCAAQEHAAARGGNR